MKLKAILLGGIAVAGILTSCQKGDTVIGGVSTLNAKSDSLSYGMGMDIGGKILESYNQIKEGYITDINKEAFLQGIKDKVLENQTAALMGDEACKQLLDAYNQEFTAKKMEDARIQGEANLAASASFLEENKKREGVTELPSGLQYEVLVEGKGEKPTIDAQVTTHYHGTLLDGTVFDSSVDRGEPATFPVNGVILGWQEAIPLMSKGSKWKLFIPSKLAYGPQGTGPGGKIGPNAALVFEVELLQVNGK